MKKWTDYIYIIRTIKIKMESDKRTILLVAVNIILIAAIVICIMVYYNPFATDEPEPEEDEIRCYYHRYNGLLLNSTIHYTGWYYEVSLASDFDVDKNVTINCRLTESVYTHYYGSLTVVCPPEGITVFVLIPDAPYHLDTSLPIIDSCTLVY